MNNYRYWTKQEEQYLVKNYATYTNSELSVALSRNEDTIQMKIAQKIISHKPKRMWRKSISSKMLDMFPHLININKMTG